ncbi:hypothetical protein BHM03_00032719 [Ensete ventricosum]|nr:hypothetical protein BHM03_00032719 [Ensete ventricosum]
MLVFYCLPDRVSEDFDPFRRDCSPSLAWAPNNCCSRQAGRCAGYGSAGKRAQHLTRCAVIVAVSCGALEWSHAAFPVF